MSGNPKRQPFVSKVVVIPDWPERALCIDSLATLYKMLGLASTGGAEEFGNDILRIQRTYLADLQRYQKRSQGKLGAQQIAIDPRNEKAATPGAQRAALKILSRKSAELADVINTLDDYSEEHLLDILEEDPTLLTALRETSYNLRDGIRVRADISSTFNAIRKLGACLVDLATAARDARPQVKVQRGSLSNRPLRDAVAELTYLWEKATGKPVTNYYSEYEEDRKVLASGAGKLIALFFKLVDPGVSENTLHDLLSAIVEERKSAPG